MTMKQVDPGVEMAPAPVLEAAVGLPNDLMAAVKFTLPTDEDMTAVAALRASSEPWKSRGETQEDSLKALAQLKPFIHVAKLQTQIVGYVTVERDGPVPGAAYLRNIVVKTELRKKGLGAVVLEQALRAARDMYRKTIALRVDPSNAPAVSFYRKAGFTTVATVVSKKSGKLRLLMSREL
ncbi:GNAT family N-acetyltransferase [Myxococcus sp. CA051A]|uniref:GNAT family N-acetyltransferase n=1 Tax=Myxococcus llanfairpwllgwyngyllgogerychwyrndrobwllllantysiliogogogochensis TaxID=2590453 RepID=A0A540X4Y3_9BACT|nr:MULTISPECIES: GNAT family N-acetyltransferase [Myxococcus]NTX03023.1 GNAT family N-acetyltransferase [Myxococcus sp. CA040A]NTX11442.1 GNAT family N-acetyltransferase [Myxococcus sp. CA056]NTX34460.1 GNAT family N-acetyltransferase [Myxococcus sp. CA033]NTX60712.1 GNAT family N-acetyltransferase [Myxococcus sp. CA051A]TQF16315.1 GNAT family N-acetyltransferase [Myxococcus llanfairpwllgwyngyllgogerychwyrndrobwllllantysiliogogogochensis]